MIPIAQAPDDEVVTVGGTVEAVGSPLTSPISAEPCVVFEVYDGFDDDRPNDRGAVDFVVRDESAKARIVTTHIDVSLLGQARHQRVQAIDANIHEVSARLSELKDRAARVHGPGAKPLHAEMRRYKRIATLLCAMKAHARGKVHGAMSKGEQGRFIERENAALRTEAGDTFHFDVERVEAVLVPGQRVHVTGRGRWEIDSEGGAGYRQAGRVLVLEGTPEAPVRVALEHGERSRLMARGAKKIVPAEATDAAAPASSPPVWLLVAVVVAIVVFLLL